MFKPTNMPQFKSGSGPRQALTTHIALSQPLNADANIPALIAALAELEPAKTPVKTKRLVAGQVVRPFVKGEPRGAVRTVESVTKVDDGAQWHVTFSSLHPALDYAASYLWIEVSA